jgi:Txe/YoeB family toxin of Txe-Axe toxin-antitoxin module
MHYQKTKANILEHSINKLVDNINTKFGKLWLYNEDFWYSKERVLLTRYNDLLTKINEVPHNITDTCHE